MPGASGLSVVAIGLKDTDNFCMAHMLLFYTVQTYYLIDIISGSITTHYFQEHKYVVLCCTCPRLHQVEGHDIWMTCSLCLLWCNSPQWARASSFTRFLGHTWWCTTVDRTSFDEWSACRRDLYLTTHNTHNWQTSMSPVGFEPTISAGEWP